MDKKTIYIFAGIAGLILLVVLVAVFSFSGGGGGGVQSGPVTLSVWMPFEESQNLQPLFDAYSQKRPNVRIVYTKKNIDTYETDLINALAAGNGPDVFAINNTWLPKYQDKITSAPEKQWLFTDYKNAFVDVAVTDFTKDQKIYGAPMSVDSLALYYNKDLLGTAGIATPPKTWAELASQVQRIRKQDTTGYFSRSGAAWGTNSNVNRAVDILYLFMLQQGARSFSADGLYPQFGESVQKGDFQINPGAVGLSFYTSFATPSSLNYTWNQRSDYSVDAFANGRAAFLISYAYTRQTLKEKAPNLNYDIIGVPQPNLENPSVNFANFWGQVVSKQSKNQANAWDLIQFMTSKEALDKYYSLTKQPSSRKDLITLQIPDPAIGVFANANLTAKSFYKPDQAKMDTIFGRMIDNVILNRYSIDDALNQAVQQAGTLTQEQN